ncbi:potassium transporter TrkA [Streptomyces sp. TRM43335]|uniref:Potassium transporter TrkA n=2 Tax=Streptomyces taklimakanensis TaxID=2569853 RepID=A0A6G2BFR4_9ACTN|nr:NAD-binding protein [Streptomyces taklimakanensis]MTE21127.1 potassium transporter TrkA [Streptomyces taklimakanensis]
MVVCGDNSLAQRLVRELASVYGQRVTVVLPSLRGGDQGPQIAALVGDPRLAVRAVEAQVPDDAALREAGIEHAAALALTSGDDQLNIHTALRARRINPELRLVIRMFNRTLGRYLEDLLDRTIAARVPGLDQRSVDASTTVLSDADTAAPSLVAAAVVGAGKVIQADGLLLRAKERTIGTAGRRDPLCTLALLPDAPDSDEGDVYTDPEDRDGPVLLPDPQEMEGLSDDRGTVVLEAITRRSDQPGAPLPRVPRLPVGSFFSRRLRASLLGLIAVAVLLAATNWYVTRETPLHSAYVTLLNVMSINDPELDGSTWEQVLQLLGALAGTALLPLLFAVVLESYGTFRQAAALPPPPRGIEKHVVLLGLGKVGTRVLDQLLELGIPVVCIERDDEARGIAVARARRVPTLIADVTEDGVLEEAGIARSRALLALTSDSGTNLEAVLYARQVHPGLRVVMRLFDDEFAATVYRTLRDTYPGAQTRSRSVSALAAPAFAGAMMGRQVLGAIPVGRRVLVFAAVTVAGNRLLEGRTVGEASRPGCWRILALDTSPPERRRADLASLSPDGITYTLTGDLVWRLHDGYVMTAGDRVVVAATRDGLGALLAGEEPRGAGADPSGTDGPGAGSPAPAP